MPSLNRLLIGLASVFSCFLALATLLLDLLEVLVFALRFFVVACFNLSPFPIILFSTGYLYNHTLFSTEFGYRN